MKKKMIAETIRAMKKGQQQSPKRHKPAQNRLFEGQSFCMPIISRELTPKYIETIALSIEVEGGKVGSFQGRKMTQEVDFLLIEPKEDLDMVLRTVKGKIKFRQILDYHYVTESTSSGAQLSYEAYSLYVNIEAMDDEDERQASGIKPNKKRKMEQEDKEEQHQGVELESLNGTIRLSDDEQDEDERPRMREEGGKIELEEALLQQKKISSFSMNKFIAEELTKLMKIYQAERDLGRKIAYSKAAAVIRAHDRQIETERDVEMIKGIGPKISDKIKELLRTGKVSKLEKLQMSQKNVVGVELGKVWGVGPAKASELYSQGIKSIADLKNHSHLLNKNQKIGLKYFEELEQKIPREKVTRAFQFVRRTLAEMVPSVEDYRIEVCGSYRRGKPSCGDIDIIIARRDGTFEKHLLTNLIEQLEKNGFLTDHLTHPKLPTDRSSSSYMGIFRHEEPTHHRIDIKYYPIEEFYFALLYFTGSGMFNRMLRLHCMKLGLNLSDHGVVPKMNKGVIWKKPIPVCYSEEDIFKFLDVKYKTPAERDM